MECDHIDFVSAWQCSCPAAGNAAVGVAINPYVPFSNGQPEIAMLNRLSCRSSNGRWGRQQRPRHWLLLAAGALVATIAAAVASTGPLGISSAMEPSFVHGLVFQLSARWTSLRPQQPKAWAGKQDGVSNGLQDLLRVGDTVTNAAEDFVAELCEFCRSFEDAQDQIEKVSGRGAPSADADSDGMLTNAEVVEGKASPAPYGLVAHDSLARRTAGGNWAVPVQAWIYRTNQKRHRIRMALCRKLLVEMRHGIKNIDAEAERRYEERGRLIFRTLVFRGGERNTILEVKFDNDNVWMPLPPTGGDGRVNAEFVLSNEVVQRALGGLPRSNSCQSGASLGMTVRIPQSKVGGQPVVARAEVLLTEPQGVLVVSDIDDTVKVTEVFMGKDQVVRNTFLEDFRPVNGMATLYSSWAKDFGAAFAFVSNSPPEFLEILREFLWDSGFPRAAVHLRPLSGGSKEERRDFKQMKIEAILATFPHRKVVLVGDSGERDPVMCAEIMRKYPEQVVKVLIRQVRHDATVDAALFHGLPRNSWQVFADPAEVVLPEALRGSTPLLPSFLQDALEIFPGTCFA